jgi:hypothetical protein
VSSLLYGGDNVTMPDPDPAKSAKYRIKLGKAYVYTVVKRHFLSHLQHDLFIN